MSSDNSSLLRHFRAELFTQSVAFWDGQVKWGMVILGFLSIVFSIIHLRPSAADIWDELLALFCSVLWVFCISVIWIIGETAKELWRHGLPVSTSTASTIILTDAEETSQKRPIQFKARLVFISAILVIICVAVAISSALFAYRTAVEPTLKPEELARLGQSGTVEIGVLLQPDAKRMPTWIPLSTGFWVSDKGYVVTCLDNVSHDRDLIVSTSVAPYLGEHTEVTGGVLRIPSAVVWSDEKSNLAILRTFQNPFGSFSAKQMGQKVQFNVLALKKEFAPSGQSILQFGFKQIAVPAFGTTAINLESGNVLRTDVSSIPSSRYALFLSVPFRPTDCGSPILNDRGFVVGMAEGSDSSSGSALTVAKPSTDIMDSLKNVGMVR
jgi:hypothetical protein